MVVAITHASSSSVRQPKSDLDRHAIGVTGHLLTTVVRLEVRLKGAAKRATESIERPSWLASSSLIQVTSSTSSQTHQPRNEEP